jgi:hypothetical protein
MDSVEGKTRERRRGKYSKRKVLTELLIVFVEAVFVEPHRPKLHPPPVPLLLPLLFMFSFLLLPAMPLILSFFFRAVMRNSDMFA